MQPLLESFESFFYVLVNTLPVGIGIGLIFFGIGFLFTNPRVRRYREQVASYKEEIARMSRAQAKITNQHQTLLENIQARDNENLVLQDTLETKDEELIGLLDRLNNVAIDAEPASSVEGGEEAMQENARLRRRIAELTGRLRTSESALQDRKVELARARRELAQVGVREEATAGRSTENGGWQSEGSSSATETVEPHSKGAIHDETEEQDAAAAEDEGDLEETAARLFSGDDTADSGPSEPAPTVEFIEPGSSVGAQIDSLEEPEFDLQGEPAGRTGSSDLEDQLAEFEARLRAKEAEFFALNDQLSFGALARDHSGSEPAADEKANAAATVEKANATQTPVAEPAQHDKPGEDAKSSATNTKTKESPPKSSSRNVSAFPPLPTAEDSTPSHAQPAEPSASLAPGEQLLFRGSDPSAWAKQTGNGLVSPATVRKSAKFLRLRRSDTGESVILRVAKKDLLASGPADGIIGWNGKGDSFQGAHHLGIFDHSLAQEVETRYGAGGWGFGHFHGSREGQAFAWAGVSVPKTDFEISALSKLPDRKTLEDTHTVYLEAPSVAPSLEDEIVFFHSSHPEIWNSNTVDGKGGFAFHVCRVPEKTRYLKVRRADNGSAVVIAASRKTILQKAGGEKNIGWNGSNEFFFAGHHLGICDPNAAREVEIAYGCGGYGFGHLVDSNDRQAVAWAGKAIARVPLEFIAIARGLTAEEKEQLLKA